MSFVTALLFLSILPLISAQASGDVLSTNTVSSSTTSSENCETKLATTRGSTVYGSSTLTTAEPSVIKFRSTSSPSTTVTPAPSTFTEVIVTFVTTISTDTVSVETISTTTTESTTTTVASFDTTTETATSTSTSIQTSTREIAEPSGFVSVQQSSGESNYDPNPPSAKFSRRGTVDTRGAYDDNETPFRNASGLIKAEDTWPELVICTTTVIITLTKEIVVLGAVKTITADPAIVTATSTDTSTTTSTVYNFTASTTQSSTVTDTQTVTTFGGIQTSTETSTTTQTETTTSTFYAACSPTNILGARIANGHYLPSFSYESNDGTYISEQRADNSYYCCEHCIQTPDCKFSVYDTKGSTHCYLLKFGTECNNPSIKAGKFFEDERSRKYDLAFSNGPCGVLESGGLGNGGNPQKV